MKRFNKILCVVEPGTNSEAALVQAERIANDHQAEITVASVLKGIAGLPKILQNKSEINTSIKELTSVKRSAIENWVKECKPDLKAQIEVYTGIGFIEIIKSVVKNEYDLVIKCANDIDWLDRLFASDDVHLLRKCPCPVLMLKPGKKEIFRNVLATVDMNDDFNEMAGQRVQGQLNKKVLEYSAVFSVSELTELHIGSVRNAYAEEFLLYSTFSRLPEEKINRFSEQIRRDYSQKLELLIKEMNELVGKDAVDYLHPKTHLVKGQPSKEIPLMAKEYAVDLIVMGTVARTGIPGFIIGNTAESILEQVHCSVLAIKPDGFKTPVSI